MEECENADELVDGQEHGGKKMIARAARNAMVGKYQVSRTHASYCYLSHRL